MEYRNNWPVYVQEKRKPVRADADGYTSSEVCIGKANKTKADVLFALSLGFKAKAEIEKKKKVEKSKLTIDCLMRQLVTFQKSADVTFSCRARKAAIELASERRRLSNTCLRLQYEVSKGRMTSHEFKRRMTAENRKAIASFCSKWANLFEVVV